MVACTALFGEVNMGVEEVMSEDVLILPPDRIVSYSHTPRDTMSDTINVSVDGKSPKKRAQKQKEETPTKDSSAGSSSTEVHSRDSIEFVRPNSARTNKLRSSVFDFSPVRSPARRLPNGVGNQRYSRSPYATHEANGLSNGSGSEYRPTTPFAEHSHVTSEQHDRQGRKGREIDR
eukprot:sb/3471900/